MAVYTTHLYLSTIAQLRKPLKFWELCYNYVFLAGIGVGRLFFYVLWHLTVLTHAKCTNYYKKTESLKFFLFQSIWPIRSNRQTAVVIWDSQNRGVMQLTITSFLFKRLMNVSKGHRLPLVLGVNKGAKQTKLLTTIKLTVWDRHGKTWILSETKTNNQTKQTHIDHTSQEQWCPNRNSHGDRNSHQLLYTQVATSHR